MKLLPGRKFWIRCGWGVGALLALLVLFIAEEHLRGRLQLHRYLTELQTRGEKLTIAELTPPPIPAQENGAALFLSTAPGSGIVVPDNLPSAMRFVAPGRAVAMVHRPAWTIKRQHELLLGTNGITAYWRTNRSADTPRRNGRTQRDGVHEPMLITAGDLVEDIRSISNNLAIVRRALSFPTLDFGLDYSGGFNNPALVKHLMPMKSAANALRAASLAALYETNHTAALENLIALANLSRSTERDPTIINHLVRISILQIAVAATWEALQLDGWTEEQLAQWQEALGRFSVLRSMEEAFRLEREVGLMSVDRAGREGASYIKSCGILELDIALTPPTLPTSFEEALEPFDAFVKSLRPMFLRFVYVPVWRLAWKDQDKLNLARLWQRNIDWARQCQVNPAAANKAAKPEEPSPMRMDGETEDQRPFYDRARFLFSSEGMVSYERVLDRARSAEAAGRLATTALALRRFDLARGRSATNLTELVPQYLKTLPMDPYDGQPLRYRSGRSGFTLYSVGNDGVDDGGLATPRRTDATLQFLDMRDLVWPMAATEAELSEFLKSEAGKNKRSPAK